MKFKVYRARRGLMLRPQWRWRLVAANHKVIADSGEGYSNRMDCLAMIDKIAALPTDTPVEIEP